MAGIASIVGLIITGVGAIVTSASNLAIVLKDDCFKAWWGAIASFVVVIVGAILRTQLPPKYKIVAILMIVAGALGMLISNFFIVKHPKCRAAWIASFVGVIIMIVGLSIAWAEILSVAGPVVRIIGFGSDSVSGLVKED